MTSKKQFIDAALSLLGVDRLVLAIHDQSFPALPEEEIGRGSPYSAGGRRFAEFISELGFNAFQLGPQGKTSRANPSPYDSTLFSKSELSISLHALANDPYWEKLIDAAEIQQVAAGSPSQGNPRDRASYQYAWQAQYEVLRKVYSNFIARADQLNHLRLAYTVWSKQHSHWLERDCIFEALTLEYGTEDWRTWSKSDQVLMTPSATVDETQTARAAELRSKHKSEIEFFQFCQWIAHQQHQRFRDMLAQLHLKLYADLQVGFSQRDMWALRHLLLPNYSLGAPPSRTNPDGQPWGYPVLNPDLYFETDENGNVTHGAATSWMITRIDKLLLDFDGLRIDHPHGIVCPWVYDSSEADALRAVQQGSRLFESPDIPEHSKLAKYAIVSEDQLDKQVPRYADGWVKELTDEQVEQYSILIQIIKDRMLAKGFEPSDIICEVLSSCPFPLRSVLKRHGLGRFRVTQKAQPNEPSDVYRSDNAQAADWIMVGTHDTKSIWKVAEEWSPEQREAWSRYLANRLQPDDQEARARLQSELAASLTRLIEAMFADLFVGPARNVSIFFSDLLGIKELYNEPGIVGEGNWVLSVPNDFEKLYNDRVARGEALNLPRVLSLALTARYGRRADARALVENLEAAGVSSVV
jgi:4-alpha-glucanotransferase